MRVQDKAKEINHSKQSHETAEEMVKDLLLHVPYTKEDFLLDAGSGKSKVWFNNFNCIQKDEVEIDDGKDFLSYPKEVDWTIGNPPYHIGWQFTEKAFKISRKGVAWLVNINGLNSNFSPSRLAISKSMGFEITSIHIIEDARWFGRYFFIIYEKNKKGILTFEKKKYGRLTDSSIPPISSRPTLLAKSSL
jgi:hypothetical protein